MRTNEQTDGQRNERTNEKDNCFQLFHGKNKSHFDDNDDDHVRLVVRKHAGFDFYSTCSLTKPSAGRHVAPFGHFIILIPSQPLFILTP